MVVNVGKDTTLKARIGWQGLTTSEYRDVGEYLLVTGTDFKNGFVDWDSCYFVDKIRYEQDRNIQLKNGDVVITKDGTIGKIGYINNLKLPATLNSGVFVIRPKKGKSIDTKYLYYVFTSKIFDVFLSKLTAGSTISHLYQKDFVNFEFTAPTDINEQKEIAKILNDTDELINSLQILIEKKESIKTGTMQQLFRFNKWAKVNLSDIFDFKQGIQCNTNNQFLEKKYGYIRFIRIIDLTQKNELPRYIKNPGKKYQIREEDLFMVRYGAPGLIGYGFNGVIANNLFRLIPKMKIFSLFFYYLLKYRYINIQETAVSTTMAALNFSVLKKFEISFPRDINEQKAIATILSDMDNEIEKLKEKLKKTKLIKEAMMDELLTGKTRLI